MCPNCFEQLKLNEFQYCPICRKPSELGKLCKKCKSDYHIDGVLIISNYQQVLISKLIKKLKYSFIKDISSILGEFVFLFLEKEKSFNLNDFTLMPVPLHKKRYNWRGFNQSEEIAKVISQKFDLKISTDLKRNKNTRPQVKLQKKERQKNVKNCFSCYKDLNNQNILLIDDIVTTCSTLDECAKILKQQGAKKVWALVIAQN